MAAKTDESIDIVDFPFTLNFPKDNTHLRFVFEKSGKEYLVSFDAIENLIAQVAEEKTHNNDD